MWSQVSVFRNQPTHKGVLQICFIPFLFFMVFFVSPDFRSKLNFLKGWVFSANSLHPKSMEFLGFGLIHGLGFVIFYDFLGSDWDGKNHDFELWFGRILCWWCFLYFFQASFKEFPRSLDCKLWTPLRCCILSKSNQHDKFKNHSPWMCLLREVLWTVEIWRPYSGILKVSISLMLNISPLRKAWFLWGGRLVAFGEMVPPYNPLHSKLYSPLRRNHQSFADVYFADVGGHTLPRSFTCRRWKVLEVLDRKGWSSNFQPPFFRVYLKLRGV